MISTDRSVFEENSEAGRRMAEYGGLADELHVIVFAGRNKQIPRRTDLREYEGRSFVKDARRISGNVFAYSTNSLNRWLYVFAAIKIGKNIIENFRGGGKPIIEESSLQKRDCGKMSGPEWLITCQDPFETGLAGYFIAKRAKAALQLQIHTDFLSPYFKKDSLLNRVRVLIAKFLIPRANCVRVVSQRIKDSLRAVSRQPSAVSVLPIFVDVEKIKNASIKTDLRQKYPQFDFIILMASRLTKEKNIGMAIEAMRGVVEKFPKTGLIIVGDGPERKNLKSQISNLKSEGNIIIENWTDDLASYYKTAGLFLLTSNYEGYGRTIVEAMAAGCPVVMTDVGLAGETVKDAENGLIVPVGGIPTKDRPSYSRRSVLRKKRRRSELEDAILKIMSDGELRAKLAANARKTIAALPDKAAYLEKYKETWENCSL